MAPACCVPPDGMSSAFCGDMQAMLAVEAIDVHGHFGQLTAKPFASTPDSYIGYSAGPREEFVDEWSSATAETVVQRAKACNIGITCVSPLKGLFPMGMYPDGVDAVEANKEADVAVTALPELLQWAVVNPRQPETFEQAAQLLKNERCCGLKIHPECHCWRLEEFGNQIFQFARDNGALVMCHSGHANSHPMDYVPFADASPSINVILAHLGNSGNIEGPTDPTHHIRAIAASKHKNIYGTYVLSA